jgi:hypothetical protein
MESKMKQLKISVPVFFLVLVLISGCNLGRNAPVDGPSTLPFPIMPTSQPEENGVFVRQMLPVIQNLSQAGQMPEPESPQTASDSGDPLPQQPDVLTIFVDSSLPAGIKAGLSLPEWLVHTESAEGASLVLSAGTDRPVGQWVYALVTPFYSLETEISAEELRQVWNGKGRNKLLLDEATYRLWEDVWGVSGDLEIVATDELLEHAWNQQNFLAIVPFEALEPRWKVLTVDGQSPLSPDFDPASYPLSLPLSINGEDVLPDLVFQMHGIQSAAPLLAGTNWNADQLTVVALTGVTALVRATAYTMEQRGIVYPGQDVREILRSADILHISNEIPFARDCPFPNPVQEGLIFCSDPDYIQLLEDIGTDVVELTGDHFADWGREAMDYTLDLYEARDWPVYGGGRNLRQGKAALTLEHNGNKIAFIGCNAKGGPYAQAGAENPGAVPCDFPYLEGEIASLSEQGYNVIHTFQHFEYYTYQAQPNQVEDSHRLADAGAVIVSGSQAHQPQGMEFYRGAFIHHGLGNLFFDQYEISQATRQGFIDQHIFYAGKYISTQLIPILFVDFARPRLMDNAEAADLLSSVFSASGW